MAKWRTIPGWNAYEVSDQGAVRRCRGGGTRVGKILKPAPTGVYLGVTLCQDGRIKRYFISVLVLMAFRGRRPTRQHQAAHHDGDTSNNRLRNLFWKTPKQNAADKIRHGTSNRGERHGNRKLSEKDIRKIRALLQTNAMQKTIAKRFEVTPATISYIASGFVWGWLT